MIPNGTEVIGNILIFFSNPMPGLIAFAHDKGDFSADSPVNQYENVVVDYTGYVSFIYLLLHIRNSVQSF